jgi:excinuclease ABC subunit C
MKYRQYKIQTVADGASDDYQSLKEVIIRRAKLTKESIGSQLLPDLLIIDGGKGQLGIIRELAKEYPVIYDLLKQVDVIALGKGEARQRSKKLT